MELDAYQRCIGGSDKKIKFCCGKDIVTDLNSILDAVNADQRVGALEQLNRAIAKHGDKDCLLATRASVLVQLHEYDQAKEVIEKLLSRNPVNPVAIGLKTTILAVEGEALAAIACLQQALELADKSISRGVLNSIRIVGALLQSMHMYMAARAHLMLYNILSSEPDPDVGQLLAESFRDPAIPSLLKIDFDLVLPPANQPWSAAYQTVVANAQRGRWAKALARSKELDAEHPNNPVLLRAIAILECRLGNPTASGEAWCKYAMLPGIPPHEAIEAMAVGVTLSDVSLDEQETQVTAQNYELSDVDAVIKILDEADRLMPTMRAHAFFQEENQPPPKRIFLVNDIAINEQDSEISLANTPRTQMTLIIHGKETDRPARMQVYGNKLAGFDDALAYIQSKISAHVVRLIEEKNSPDAPQFDLRAFPAWAPHPLLTERKHAALTIENFRAELSKPSFLDSPLSDLGGKSPREAVQDAYLKTRFLAWLLIYEDELESRTGLRCDLNETRKALGLPTRDPIAPANLVVDRVPLVRFRDIDFAQTTDDQLLRALRILKISTIRYPTTLALHELMKRPHLHAQEDMPLHYVSLAFGEADAVKGLEYFERAKTECIKRNMSTAFVLLYELDFRLGNRIVEGLRTLMRDLELRHADEPGVTQALVGILQRYGLVDENGRAPRHSHDHDPLTCNDPTHHHGTEGSGGAIWTPDTAKPAQESKSKLWLPGME